MSIKIPIETSARHIHISREDFEFLFGEGAELHYIKELSQPGQYLCEERLTVRGPKGDFANMAILGPFRRETQVELSLTDTRKIGLPGIIRQSGDIADTPGCTLIGPLGELEIKRGVIVAKRHIHLTPEDAARFGVRDKQTVKLKAYTGRPVIFEDVAVRVSPEFASYVHLDYDEANACGFRKGDLGRILP